MHLDVLDLRNFYYRSPLGRAAQNVIRDRLLEMWPEAKGQTVAGFGFSVPLLRPYLKEARRVIALMPGPQGVMPWPAGQPNVSVLSEEMWWPLPTGFVDKLVMMHGLETSENPSAVLDEAARVLGPGGKAMFVVPNRAGLWARNDHTPFGYGRPYSIGQFEAQLKRHGFVPERHTSALYQPPSNRQFWRKMAGVCERLGRKAPVMAGGVLMVEVVKQGQPKQKSGLKNAVKAPLDVLDGLIQPKPKPAYRA